MTQIFINYRTADEGFATVTLDNCLSARFGAANVFRDSRSVPPGQAFEPVLWRNLARTALLVVVIGPHWFADGKLHREDDFVRKEIAFALQLGIDVLPVLVGGVGKPPAEALPVEIRALADRQYRRIHARSADVDVRALVDDVAALLGESVGPTDPPSGTRTNGGTGGLRGDRGEGKHVRYLGYRAADEPE